MENNRSFESCLLNDLRFQKALHLFNAANWYQAHDVFEELWHEASGPERRTLQGILQVAVAQLHLERGNRSGATILFGEGLGRLRTFGTPDLGLDIHQLCECIERRLIFLQRGEDFEGCDVPTLTCLVSDKKGLVRRGLP